MFIFIDIIYFNEIFIKIFFKRFMLQLTKTLRMFILNKYLED